MGVVNSKMIETYNKLFKSLKPSDLILTSSKRLMAFLHKNYASYQQLQKKVWPTPLILQLETWITLQWEKQLLQTHTFPYRLLTNNQERILWQSIIKKSTQDFLMMDQIAKTAQQAWQLTQHYQLDYQASYFAQNSESQAWQCWAEQVVEFLQEHNSIDFMRATIQLIDIFKKKILTPPERIFLIGFDEISPQTKKLFASLEALGCQVSTFTVSAQNPVSHRLALENSEMELETMARWAYQNWQAGKKNIVCALPNLLTLRSQIIDCFSEVFANLHPNELDPLPFNVAAGKRLSEFPMIQMALSILQIKHINPLHKISLLIRSPYLAYAEEEQSSRAQLDIHCRRYLENILSLEQLATISLEHYCPRLNQLIHRLIPITSSYPPEQYPSQWAIHFAQKLQACAWPGQRALHSEAFQLLERWSELLNEFSGLDFILGKLNNEHAWQYLSYLTEETRFQAKTSYDPPIQVLGLLDTAGLTMDSLWVMGLDDKSWPGTVHPNPFIPYVLQRHYALPHASCEREFYFSSLITQRLLNSAQTIVMSHSTKTQQQNLRPSALITTLPTIQFSDLALPNYTTAIESIWATRVFEYYADDKAPALQMHELTSESSQLFKLQAACPFQAFAHFRLRSRFAPLPRQGLKPSERGTLLHSVIETLWNKLGDQATLLKQSPQTLQILIKQAITSSLTKFSQKYPFTFQPQFIAIEQERLQQRLNKLLELDKQRSNFNHVIHEQKQKFIFANLSLNLRIDRLDELPDGTQLIIDYKTGTPTKFKWLDERLDEPQLPLYCLSQPNAKGFAVIHIHSNALQTQGLSEKENGLSQNLTATKEQITPQHWSELLDYWKAALTKLAKQFQEGIASVDPKKGTHTCRLCHLQLFCRVNHHEDSY
jgi:ATP-dependent helicase/nuclease subunit B